MFSWFRDRAKAKKLYEQDLKLALNAKRLHGVNLEKWHYLGYSEITYSFNDTKETINAHVHLFALKDDLSRRHYELVADNNYYFQKFLKHTWITVFAELWKAGEEELYQPVHSPSRWLKDYMLEQHQHIWDTKKKWWRKKIDSVEDNVIKLDFKQEKS